MMERRKENIKGYIDEGLRFFYLTDEKAMSFDYHFHAFHKCLIIKNGELNYAIEGREYVLQAGDILWVPCYEAHRLKVSSNKTYERLVVYIAAEFFELVDRRLDEGIRRIGVIYPNHLVLPTDIRQKLFALEEKIMDTFQNNQTEGLQLQLIRTSCFLEWLSYYMAEMKSEATLDDPFHSIDDITRKMIDYVQTHIYEPITIETIGEEMFMSKYHLMRRFKEATGLSVHQYIIHKRLNRARQLMKEGMALTSIAYAVGFSDYSTFARAFKKAYALSPRKFQGLNPTKVLE